MGLQEESSKDLNIILATDCGSTTSKARFFKKINGEYRYVTSGEAPTTVEAPFEDVTYGITNAIKEVEELTGHRIMGAKGIITPSNGSNIGVDLYITTSSAGGGLQMMCSGVIRSMTAESAERASLGAGAIVMDVLAIDDGRPIHEKIRRVRMLRPDIILVAGGTDGGTIDLVTSMAEIVASADPKARFGAEYSLPVIYAGNKDAVASIKDILEKKYALVVVPNVRPTMDMENPEPTRDAIHECFMEHVMSHAPGYDKLMKWTPIPILPTPAGEGRMFQTIAKMYNANVIGVGLGGATTNIYSIFDGRFVRTVSANLGMSYSVGNVLKQTGVENIIRWLPFEIDEIALRHKLYNKMFRPTTIPSTLENLLVEHAIAREALRMGFIHHRFLARPLQGMQRDQKKMEANILAQQEIQDTFIDMKRLQWLGGTGGLLSHAPRRIQSALVLIDGFQPEGVTKLAQDSVFMMPHLGVLSTVSPKAAMDIFEKDCLVRLGTCITPLGQPKDLTGAEEVASFTFEMPDGSKVEKHSTYGTIEVIPLPEGANAKVEIRPTSRFDFGQGSGKTLDLTVEGGVAGIIIDARGRPIHFPEDDQKRIKQINEWFNALNAYPPLEK